MQFSAKIMIRSLALSTCLLLSMPGYASEPMLDGQCSEHQGAATPMGEGVSLAVSQTAEYVWLCVAVPTGSYGVVDLRIEAPLLPEALNLHASAQLAEWAADRPGAAPTSPESPIWGNNLGWVASVTPFAGMDASASPPRARFRPINGREFQLSKTRFGKGPWRIRLAVQAIATPDGSMVELRFPEEADETYVLEVT